MEQEGTNIFACLASKDYAAFSKYVQRHKARSDTFDLAEFFQTIPTKDYNRLFSGLRDMLVNMIQEESFASVDGIACIRGSTTLSSLFLKDKSIKNFTEAVQDTVCALHHVLIPLYQLSVCNNLPDTLPNASEISTLANDISVLCELYFSQSRPSREEITPQTLTYLLLKALEAGKPNEIKRVYNFREALTLMDLQDDSSLSLKSLLLACMIRPLFLQNPDGRKFLAFLFTLSPPFIDNLHETIKGQLPLSKKSLREAYAEVYFRAWSLASGAYLLKIEYSCIEDLMYSSIYCKTEPVVIALRHILSYFHLQKVRKGVDEMLVRLYEPILWRSLKVANPEVRRNAAALFVDAFPLENSEKVSRDENPLQSQFNTLSDLLSDPSPIVRVVAVQGSCQIMGRFWELVPLPTSRVLLGRLVNDLANDKNSAPVRAAVFEGLRFVLDNPLSQPTIKVLLPALCPLIHDKSVTVRSAFVDLLLLIKGMSSIKLFDVVPIDHLLARLGIEAWKAPITIKLTTLLLESYFPYNQRGTEQVARALTLFESNPQAALKFYSHVYHSAPLSNICKLLGLFYRLIWKCKGRDLDNLQVGEEPQIDVQILENVAETIGVMWYSISDQLKKAENELFKEALHRIVTDETLCEIYNWFPTTRGKLLILRISSHLPKESIPTFHDAVLPLFRSVGENEGDGGDGLHVLLECMYKWEDEDEVLDALTNWVQAPLNQKRESSVTNTKRKRVDGSVSSAVTRAILALNAFSSLMTSNLTRPTTLQKITHIVQLVGILSQYIPVIQKRVLALLGIENTEAQEGENWTVEDDEFFTDELLLSIYILYCKMIIHITGSGEGNREKDSPAMMAWFQWVTEALVPSLQLWDGKYERVSQNTDTTQRNNNNNNNKRKGQREKEKSKDNENSESEEQNESEENNEFLPLQLLQFSCLFLTEFVGLGFCTHTTATNICTLFDSLLSTHQWKILTHTLPAISRFIYLLYEMNLDHPLPISQPPCHNSHVHYGGIATNLLCKAVDVFSTLSRDRSEGEKIFTEISLFRISDIFLLHHQKGTLPNLLKGFVPILLTSMDSTMPPRGKTPKNIKEVADVSCDAALLLFTLHKSANGISALCQALQKYLNSNDPILQYKSLQILSTIVNECGSSNKDLSSIQNTLINFISKLTPTETESPPSNTTPTSTSTTITSNELRQLADTTLKITMNTKAIKSNNSNDNHNDNNSNPDNTNNTPMIEEES